MIESLNFGRVLALSRLFMASVLIVKSFSAKRFARPFDALRKKPLDSWIQQSATQGLILKEIGLSLIGIFSA